MEIDNPLGNCLVSYDNSYIEREDNDEIFNGHSSKWESREIALIFSRLGYNVDIINWQDTSFVPEKNYDIIFDIHHIHQSPQINNIKNQSTGSMI